MINTHKNIINIIDKLYNLDIKKIIKLSTDDYKNLLLNDLVNNQYKKIYKTKRKSSPIYIKFDLLTKENLDVIKDKFNRGKDIIYKYNNKNDIYLNELNKVYNSLKFKKIERLLNSNITLDNKEDISKKVISNYLKKNIFIKLKLNEYNNFNNYINNLNNNERIIEAYDKAFSLTLKNRFKVNLNDILDEIEKSYENKILFNNTISYLKETIMRLS